MALINERYELQKYILAENAKHNIVVRDVKKDFDVKAALDLTSLFEFLEKTQATTLDRLQKTYLTREVVRKEIVAAIVTKSKTKSKEALLKEDLTVNNEKIRLFYPFPSLDYNEAFGIEDMAKHNTVSVMQEVYNDTPGASNNSERERVDLVYFINGIPAYIIELKADGSGKNYYSAIDQLKKRNNTTTLLRPKTGPLAIFAMDQYEVYYTTELKGKKTHFKAYKKEISDRVEEIDENYYYNDIDHMTKVVLTRDKILDYLQYYIYTSLDKDNKEKYWFPRYHQFEAIENTMKDLTVEKIRRFLYEEAPGAGKTYMIAVLAKKLANLKIKNRKKYDVVLASVDTVNLVENINKQIVGYEKNKDFLYIPKTSAQLMEAIRNKKPIITSTMQKFPHLLNNVKNDDGTYRNAIQDLNVACIIDEAQDSTSGEEMLSLIKALYPADNNVNFNNPDDVIKMIVGKNNSRSNIDFFAFSATPKATTLQLFGRQVSDGLQQKYVPYHRYTMQQSNEEGYTLNVLQNYITVGTLIKIAKLGTKDPLIPNNDTKKFLNDLIRTNPNNIDGRSKIIVDHFCGEVGHILDEEVILDGKKVTINNTKGMVINEMRYEAVLQCLSMRKYILDNKIANLKVGCAFSGKIEIRYDKYEKDRSHIGTGADATINLAYFGSKSFLEKILPGVDKYLEVGYLTEGMVNGFPEAETLTRFDKDVTILVAADKYQKGFDQPKLCAMYVCKRLKGTNIVQTLCRLDRVYPNKKTFILDFENSKEEVEDAFREYYYDTELVKCVDGASIENLSAKIDKLGLIEEEEYEKFSNWIQNGHTVAADKLLNNKSKEFKEYYERTLSNCDEGKVEEFKAFYKACKAYIRCYTFIMLSVPTRTKSLYMKYQYLKYLLPHLQADITARFSNTLSKEEKEELEAITEITVTEYKKKKEEIKLPEPQGLAISSGTRVIELDEDVRYSSILKKYFGYKEKDDETKYIEGIVSKMLSDPEVLIALDNNSSAEDKQIIINRKFKELLNKDIITKNKVAAQICKNSDFLNAFAKQVVRELDKEEDGE